jgi:3-hydroxybutyryl-CoA dehydratase
MKNDSYQFEVVISEEMLTSFARLSGDENPLHISHDHARSLGFSGRIAHGMLLGSLISRMVGMHLPGGNVLILSTKMDFHHPVHIGDQLMIRGRIESRSEGTGTATLKVAMERNNETVSRASVLIKELTPR